MYIYKFYVSVPHLPKTGISFEVVGIISIIIVVTTVNDRSIVSEYPSRSPLSVGSKNTNTIQNDKATEGMMRFIT